MRRRVLLAAMLAMMLCGAASAQQFFSVRGVALDGYDVVTYHTEDEAVQGVREHRIEWNGSDWYFANDRNARLFAADPERYAPAYGGYCAYAAANNAVAPVDPKAFTVIDETLYLNFSPGVKRRWDRDQEKYINLADQYWPALSEEL